jgi:DNA repair protein RadC
MELVMGASQADAGRRVLAAFQDLDALAKASLPELAAAGLGPAGAARVQAAIELGRRLVCQPAWEAITVNSPADIAALLLAEMGALTQEQIRVVLLNIKNAVVGVRLVYQGSLNTNVVRIAELFSDAIKEHCAALVVVHNHPSGDPTPSPEDVAVTRDIVKAGALLSIDVLDHLVIGQGRFVSLKERGLGF